MPFIAVAGWSAERSRVETGGQLREEAASVASTAGAYLNTYLAGLDSMSSALARHPAVMALDRSQCDPLFAAVLRDQPLLLNIVVSDSRGAVRGTAIPSSASHSCRRRRCRTSHEVMRTGKPQVSELMTGRISNQPTIVLSYPVRDAGKSSSASSASVST